MSAGLGQTSSKTLNPVQPAELQPYKTTNWNWRRAGGEALRGLGFIPCHYHPLCSQFLFFSFNPNRPLAVCFFTFQALCAPIWNKGGTIIGSDADARRWSFLLLRQNPNTLPCRPYSPTLTSLRLFSSPFQTHYLQFLHQRSHFYEQISAFLEFSSLCNQ